LAKLPSLELSSVRSLQEIIVWAGTLEDIADPTEMNAAIRAETLARAVQEYQADLNPREQEMIALTALSMTRISSLLPWNGLTGYKAEAAEWPHYLEGLIDRNSGSLDRIVLANRLRDLCP
jgi:hypothetical protein